MEREPVRRGNIGIVVPAFDRGGLEQVVLNLYRGLRRSGLQCIVLIENNESGYMASRVEKGDVFIFNRDESLFLRVCRRRQIEVLSYHYSTFGIDSASALGIYTTYTLHNVYTWLDDADFMERARMINAANSVIAVSTFVRDYFCRRSGTARDIVEVVSNGIDVAEMTRSKLAISKEDLGLSPDRFVFGVIASFHRNKHHLLSLRASEILSERRDDFEVVMIGNAADRNYYDQVRCAIDESAIPDRVRIVDYRDRDWIGAIYRDVLDGVLLVSIQEGCSNVVLEALVFGLPMVLTDVGGAREAAAVSKDVYIVPPSFSDLMSLRPEDVEYLSNTGDTSNSSAVADSMEKIIEEFKQRGRSSVSVAESVSSERMVEEYLNIFLDAPLLGLS